MLVIEFHRFLTILMFINMIAVANAPPRASTMTRANKAKLFENSINYVDSTRTSQPPATADSKVQVIQLKNKLNLINLLICFCLGGTHRGV